MPLIPYNSPVPCYSTVDIVNYDRELFSRAAQLFELTQPRVANGRCIAWPGSFSIQATSSDETVAKIVIFQNNVGRWGPPPRQRWVDGVYIWIRANGDSGEQFASGAKASGFPHEWVLSRFEQNAAVAINPNPAEHFYYFQLSKDDSIDDVVALLAWSSEL